MLVKHQMITLVRLERSYSLARIATTGVDDGKAKLATARAASPAVPARAAGHASVQSTPYIRGRHAHVGHRRRHVRPPTGPTMSAPILMAGSGRPCSCSRSPCSVWIDTRVGRPGSVGANVREQLFFYFPEQCSVATQTQRRWYRDSGQRTLYIYFGLSPGSCQSLKPPSKGDHFIFHTVRIELQAPEKVATMRPISRVVDCNTSC